MCSLHGLSAPRIATALKAAIEESGYDHNSDHNQRDPERILLQVFLRCNSIIDAEPSLKPEPQPTANYQGEQKPPDANPNTPGDDREHLERHGRG